MQFNRPNFEGPVPEGPSQPAAASSVPHSAPHHPQHSSAAHPHPHGSPYQYHSAYPHAHAAPEFPHTGHWYSRGPSFWRSFAYPTWWAAHPPPPFLAGAGAPPAPPPAAASLAPHPHWHPSQSYYRHARRHGRGRVLPFLLLAAGGIWAFHRLRDEVRVARLEAEDARTVAGAVAAGEGVPVPLLDRERERERRGRGCAGMRERWAEKRRERDEWIREMRERKGEDEWAARWRAAMGPQQQQQQQQQAVPPQEQKERIV
ncbi:uncharacterized protein JCM10292_006788 [Rhodotorula paludigena]|uniref:uncharacterized protein n=1 Tax=Rhodotorula paludigena TaxID=86838 RepID=UPI003180AAE7